MKNKISTIFKENPEDTSISSSKLWFNIANTAIITIYCMVGCTLSKNPEPNLEGLAWLTLVVAGVVTANKFANKFLGFKYGGKDIVEEVSEKKTKKTGEG